MQPGATPSTAWPTVPLQWGDFNVLHTTDTHGWLMGHLHASQPEPNYSGDLGDLASFVSHMKDTARKQGADLLLIDSGDLHNGNGLSDGYPVGEIDGQRSNKFLSQLPYDVMAIGNQELYLYSVANDMHTNFAPRLKGRYLTSDVNITVPDKKTNASVSVPLGSRFAKFHTERGRKVTAFGVIFGFTGNTVNTTVQKVDAMVNETWFKDAIQEEPDVFLLVGHMPVQKDKWPVVFNAIRAVHATTPILVFGGHTHIRDCVQYDNRSMALESGQYMETVGWLSANLTGTKHSTSPIGFSRRYLDANRNTYQFHTGTVGTKSHFDTRDGKSITDNMHKLADSWNLTTIWGTAPQDFYLNRVQYPGSSSLVSLFADQVMPKALDAANPARATIPRVPVLDTGSQRFDVYSGPFTRNDQFIVSPFTNIVQYLAEVPASIATQVAGRLNGKTATRRSLEEEYASGKFRHRYAKWKREQYENYHFTERDATLSLGYVTTDSCPGVGDDIPHTPMPHYDPPKYVSPPLDPAITPDTLVDLVFFDFYASKVLTIVNSLSTGKTYAASDVQGWGASGPLITNAVYEAFVKEAWGAGSKCENVPPYPTSFLLNSLYGIRVDEV
ncbi:hypothetical protein FRC06_002568 [Ceratobasidium sp. 370]|nr:hypothetical protein FRC06_002568 [Ceratobasidium sp. 370]